MVLGLVLLPEVVVAAQIMAYSARLSGSGEAVMQLGEDAPPHITILHADLGGGRASAWWEMISPLVSEQFVCQFAGLIFHPIPAGDYYVPDGGVSAGIEVVRTPALEQAHVASLEAVTRLGGSPVGAVGDRFRPHVTLNVLHSFPEGRIPFADELVVMTVPVRLALGELGPFGTVPKMLNIRE